MNLPTETLTGRFVALEPLTDALKDELRAALDLDAEAWSVMSSSAMGEAFESWWAAALTETRAGRRIAFAVRDRSRGAVIGTTSWVEVRAPHRGVEIGATFYRPEARGGPVNPECKRLLLAAAFEAGAVRVELVTDARNTRSQAAILKLGAKAEGVLRRHKITWTGHVRDTAVFSVVDEEWSAVREGLDRRLAAWV